MAHPVVAVVALALLQPLLDVVAEFPWSPNLAVDELDPVRVTERLEVRPNRTLIFEVLLPVALEGEYPAVSRIGHLPTVGHE